MSFLSYIVLGVYIVLGIITYRILSNSIKLSPYALFISLFAIILSCVSLAYVKESTLALPSSAVASNQQYTLNGFPLPVLATKVNDPSSTTFDTDGYAKGGNPAVEFVVYVALSFVFVGIFAGIKYIVTNRNNT